MSLLTPSPGEIYDRLSIIALKIESGNQAPHLVAEHQALSRRLVEYVGAGVTAAMRDEFNAKLLVEKLGAVNAFIWHKEDAIRKAGEDKLHTLTKEDWGAPYVAALAIEIRALADRRHHLIAEIDRLFGEERAGKEKSWMRPQGLADDGPRFGFSGFKSTLDPVHQTYRCPQCNSWSLYYEPNTKLVRCNACTGRTDPAKAAAWAKECTR